MDFKPQITRLAQRHWGVLRQLTKTAFFIAAALKEHILQLILPKGVFISLLTEEFYGFSAKVLPTCWIDRRDLCFFPVHKIKMSKQN